MLASTHRMRLQCGMDQPFKYLLEARISKGCVTLVRVGMVVPILNMHKILQWVGSSPILMTVMPEWDKFVCPGMTSMNNVKNVRMINVKVTVTRVKR